MSVLPDTVSFGPSSVPAQPQEAGNRGSADEPTGAPTSGSAPTPALEAYEQLVQELTEAQEREAQLRQSYEAQLAEARAAMHHFACCSTADSAAESGIAKAATRDTITPLAISWSDSQLADAAGTCASHFPVACTASSGSACRAAVDGRARACDCVRPDRDCSARCGGLSRLGVRRW